MHVVCGVCGVGLPRASGWAEPWAQASRLHGSVGRVLASPPLTLLSFTLLEPSGILTKALNSTQSFTRTSSSSMASRLVVVTLLWITSL